MPSEHNPQGPAEASVQGPEVAQCLELVGAEGWGQRPGVPPGGGSHWSEKRCELEQRGEVRGCSKGDAGRQGGQEVGRSRGLLH